MNNIRCHATVLLYTARPDGLIQVMTSAAKQKFNSPWELLVVDAFYEERKELVEALWHELTKTRVDRPALVHVPPLPPLPNRPWRHCWDIPLFMNTGWAYARGEVLVQIEDHMCFKDTWLENHVKFINAHHNLVSIGHVQDAPLFDDNAPGHYGRKTPELLREEMLAQCPNMLDRFQDGKLSCANTQCYGAWLSGNTGFWLENIIKTGASPEWPTHWPEVDIAPALFKYGLTMWPLENVPAWHQTHPSSGVAGQIMSRDIYGTCLYESVIAEPFSDIKRPADLRPYQRDLVAERMRSKRWVP